MSATVIRIHVAEGFFLPRRLPDQTAEWNGMIAAKDELERRGVEIIEHGTAAEILPGIWVTGPVIRTPLHELETRARRLIGARPPGLPYTRWIARLRPGLSDTDALDEAIALHQRLRGEIACSIDTDRETLHA